VFKTCSKCRVVKSLEEFNKDFSKCDGYRTRCRACQSIDFKNYRKANKNKLDKKNKKYK
jgi:hypothetical protein